MPAPQELITQFTEDAYATQDRLCDRGACKKPEIKKGDPLYYVATYNATNPGKFVCGPCYIHYLEKASSSVRTSTSDATGQRSVNVQTRSLSTCVSASQAGAARHGRGSISGSFSIPDPQSIRQAMSVAQYGRGSISGSFSTPDPQSIRQAISAAQSRSTLNPPPVVAMSPSYGSLMPPPPVPLARLQHGQHGPNVHVPNMWGALGYGPQHLQYDHHKHKWVGRAHQAAPAQTYSLEISAVYESGVRKKNMRGNVFGSICEGVKDVNASSSAKDLTEIALKTLLPRIISFCPTFAWRDDEFVVRDKEWVNLLKVDDDGPYFYDHCLRECTRKNSKTKVFKTGKQFALFVVVPERQWEELEEFKERELVSSRNIVRNAASGFAHRTTRHSNILPPPAPSTVASSQADTPNLHSALALSSSVSSARVVQTQAANTDTVPSVDGNFSSISKRQHSHSDSSISDSTRSPPPKKCGLPPAFASPNHDRLKLALQSGGGADLNVKNVLRVKIEPVDFYPIPVHELDELIGVVGDGSKAAFDINTAERFSGQLRVDPSREAFIRQGAFKTTQAVQLTLMPPRPIGLGSVPNHAIAVKRPYVNMDGGSGGPPYLRLHVGDEMQRLYCEANVLYWAMALLNMVYTFIDGSIAEAKDLPSFDIPRLCFVEAGLLMAYAERPGSTQGSASGRPKPGTVSTVYLAEEVIAGEFFKYIHNGDASPRLLEDDTAAEIAEFLSFTQHVQYVKTGGQVYISDYQGSTTLLTDPQILTHPDVGMNLFGDGNIETGVERFEEQHICNRYCCWPGFKLLPFSRPRQAGSETSY